VGFQGRLNDPTVGQKPMRDIRTDGRAGKFNFPEAGVVIRGEAVRYQGRETPFSEKLMDAGSSYSRGGKSNAVTVQIHKAIEKLLWAK